MLSARKLAIGNMGLNVSASVFGGILGTALGYESGQPSVIEGALVDINVPNIVKSPIEAANGVELENGGAIGKTLLTTQSFTVNKGQSSLNSLIQSQNTGNAQTVNSTFNRQIQVAGNNSGIQNIKNTGVISVNPILTSAMFRTSIDPSSKYLLETRSQYVNLNGYYGSDYFTQRVGYTEIWDRVKRLGDAYYENQLLTRALNEKLGTGFLNGMSNQELIQSMMDNAGTESRRLGLVVGQELTQEQIDNLEEDIVWYTTAEVNGIQVLTPQIYLSSKTRGSLSDDTRNRIGGVYGTKVKTDDFVNEGMKIGNGGITYVEANTVRNATTSNLLSEITGNQTVIKTVGNIENIGGLINGDEAVALISEKDEVINSSTKTEKGYYNSEFDRGRYEEISNVGAITTKDGTVAIKAKSYVSEAGILNTDALVLDVENLDLRNIELTGEDKHGNGSGNFSRYSEKTNVGAGVYANSLSGNIGNLNMKGSTFLAEDTTGLTVGKINAESVVNEYETEEMRSSRGFMSRKSSYTSIHGEENVASNLMLGRNARITGDVNIAGSNVVLGDNTYVEGKINTDSRELNNSYYNEEKRRGFTGGISRGTVSVGYGKSSSTYDEKSTVNAMSNLSIGDGSVLNNGANITATNFEHGNIQINNGDVVYGARKDTRDIHTTSKSSNIGVSIGINSPMLDRIRQAGDAVGQVRSGDTAGGAMTAINAATGTVSGLAGNQGNRQRNYDSNQSVGKKGVQDASANNNFYANIGVNAGFSKSKSETDSHIESAVVSTITGKNPNSTITYNNVGNITYQGTQARDTSAVYNNVETITKEAVELNNRYSSSGSSFGINAGATIGYGHKMQTTGNGGSVSFGRNNQNTDETIYHNGSFTNVNEVHNNTGTMIVSGFNQEGGKVTGNISNLIAESRQNTSTTTGRSSGMNIGVSSQGIPNSIGINGSRTAGSRAYVDNQTTFIVGEGSNLTVGKANNTGAVISTTGNGTIDIQSYTGKDIQNYDTMKTTGGSVGLTTGNAPLSNIGFNKETNDRQGVTRNTVVGSVEIGNATGDAINRDISRANETTKDTHSRTNINVESQTIQYAANPDKLKEDLNKAKQEIKDVAGAFKESINDRGDDNRNFFGQLRETRLNETIYNIAGERLDKSKTQEDIRKTLEATYKDLGYDVRIRFSTAEETAALKGKSGTAYVGDDGVLTAIINLDYLNGKTKGEIIGVISEEASHVINGYEGRQIATGTSEKGLESTGRATNEYFKEKYKDDNTRITLTSEGAIDTSKLGTNVGDDVIVPQKKWGENKFSTDDSRKKLKSLLEEVYNKLYKKNEDFFEKIDWSEYEKNFIYREKINYYYLVSLNTVKNINEFKKNKGDFVEMPETEALFHNISGNKIKINGNLNRKFVNPSNGKEVVLNSTLSKIITDVDNRGTFNYYTYRNDNWLNSLMTFGDKLFHSIDIKNWVSYGTGIDDRDDDRAVMRRRELLSLGIEIASDYKNIKNWAKKNNIESIGREELKKYYKYRDIKKVKK